jgi:negative regulator of flagellin synthesis FlgM
MGRDILGNQETTRGLFAPLGERAMEIQGINFVHGPQGTQGPHRSTASTKPAASSLGEVDQLDISPSGSEAARALDLSGIRAERVAEIRAAIESGTYETDEKLNLALDRLIDEIA